MAFGVVGTNSELQAWIAALLIDARFVIGAVGIGFAFGSRWRYRLIPWYAALNVRRTIIAWRARANRLMVYGIANGIHAACIDAWVGAFLVEACAI